MIELLVVFMLVFVLLSGIGVFAWLLVLHGRISKNKQVQERNYEALRDSIESLRKEMSHLQSGVDTRPAPPLLPEHPSRKVEEPRTVTQQPVADSESAEHPPTEGITQEESAALFDLEEKVGANWLLKLGMAMVVIGISLFLGYTFQRLGPAGKVAIGIFLSAVCVIGGSLIERQNNYIVFGRVILSGGWALAYFTAYAMRHIEATRLLASDAAGLMAMGLVSVGMIVHSLKYGSEFFTGFAYGLSFLALMVSRAQWSGLIAATMLAASIGILLRFRKWYWIEPFAIVATYLHHLIWLYPIIDPMGDAKTFFQEFNVSFVMLISYWVIFTASHFTRSASISSKDRRLQAAMILNAVGFAGISVYQSFSRQWSFEFFLIVGALYFALAVYSKVSKRRNDFLTASTLGAMFVFIAIPYRFSEQRLSLLWLLEIELFLVAGYLLREIQFRRIAWLITIPFLIYHAFEQFVTFINVPFQAGLLAVSIAFLINSIWGGKKYGKRLNVASERLAAAVYGYYGLVTFLNFVRLGVADEWLGVAWATIVPLLVIGGYFLGSGVLKLQGVLLASIVVIWCLLEGLDILTSRILRSGLVALLFLGSSFLSRLIDGQTAKPEIPRRHYSEEFYFVAAVAVATALLWAETRSGYLTAAWAIEGVAIFLSAILLDRRAYRLLGLGLLMVCTGKILLLDVWNLGTFHRIVTFIVLGVSLVLISFLYTKYKDAWRKLILGKA